MSTQWSIRQNAALIVVDVQKGFDLLVEAGERRNHPEAERNIERLLDVWQASERPVVFARHNSLELDSVLRPGQIGNDYQDFVAQRVGKSAGPELEVHKTVNSAFLGTPDLHDWMDQRGVEQMVVVGMLLNGCVETTVRMGNNLGFEVVLPLDGSYSIEATGPAGERLTAAELTRSSAVALHTFGFARVTETAEVLARLES